MPGFGWITKSHRRCDSFGDPPMAVSGLSSGEIASPRIRTVRTTLSHVQKYVNHAYGLPRQKNVARGPSDRVAFQLFVDLSWGIDNLYKNIYFK
jgi:hypothetical protein